MSAKEEVDVLVEAIELSLRNLSGGPPLSHYGHIKEDCALAHIDYFAGVSESAMHLIGALAEVTEETAPDLAKRLRSETPCDCKACIGPEAAQRARDEYAATLPKAPDDVAGRLDVLANAARVAAGFGGDEVAIQESRARQDAFEHAASVVRGTNV